MLVHRSNRSERLVEMLAELLVREPPDPMAPEWIVVQSRGMERWLTQQLSRRLGVWANPRFPFPRALVEQLFAASEPSAEAAEAAADRARGFSEQTLVWSMAAALERRAEHPELLPLGRYLDAAEGASRHERLFQLAERLARRFDDYALYRGELVQSWEGGGDGGWQASLWRTLVARHGAEHVAARAQRYFAAARAGSLRADALPGRLFLFGVGSLPPLYLRMLEALPERVQVHLFAVSPCQQYWGLIRPERSIERRLAVEPRLAAGAQAPDAAQALHFEVGNPLLAAFGRLGRDFAELLAECGARDGAELYEAPDDRCLLGALQADILALRDPRRDDPEAPARLLADDDASLSIHSCHGPTRELQVLHDQLLELFERDETLEPRDVVVMAPDIEAYAPVIEAVFGAREERGAIPHQVADRSAAANHEVIDACFALLEALPSRMGASKVLDLLGYEPVRRRFGVAAEELEACRAWVADSAVRWGMDAAHRAREGQPGLEGNTWRFGLERLLLGRALDSESGLYFGRLACDGVEGSEAEVLGRLLSFIETLFEASRACAEPRSVAAWRQELGAWLERLLSPGAATAYQLQALGEALALLAEHAEQSGFDAAIDLGTLSNRLAQALTDVLAPHLAARGFLSGGVTFCQLTPMRSIPFRVVCLIGMNDEAFPRSDRPLSFDLMASARRLGDRSRRDDDRYLFLEALLSARERLLITYVGQGVQDNQPRPPSVVVSELVDAVRRGFVLPGSAADEESPLPDYEARLVVRHPLQPFSPRYFRAHAPGDPDARLFSYAAHYCEGARALERAGSAPSFAGRAGDHAGFEPGELLRLDHLERYLVNPARAYLQLRLGLFLGDEAVQLAEREPIELDLLEQWELGHELLVGELSVGRAEEHVQRERARGRIPLGTPGVLAVQGVLPTARALAERATALRRGQEPEARGVELDLGGVRLVGSLDGLTDGGRVQVQYSRVGSSSELRAWLAHLVLNVELEALDPANLRRTTHLVGRAEKGRGLQVVSFAAVTDARAELSRLLALLPHGREGALPLFKYASRAYASACFDRESRDDALDRALEAFESKGMSPDVRDAYVRQLYPSFDAALAVPAPASFEQAALTLYQPLFSHRSAE